MTGFFSKIFNNQEDKINSLQKEIQKLKKELEKKNQQLNILKKEKDSYSDKAEKISKEVVEEALSNKENSKKGLLIKKILKKLKKGKKLSFSRLIKDLRIRKEELEKLTNELKQKEIIILKKPLIGSAYIKINKK